MSSTDSVVVLAVALNRETAFVQKNRRSIQMAGRYFRTIMIFRFQAVDRHRFLSFRVRKPQRLRCSAAPSTPILGRYSSWPAATHDAHAARHRRESGNRHAPGHSLLGNRAEGTSGTAACVSRYLNTIFKNGETQFNHANDFQELGGTGRSVAMFPCMGSNRVNPGYDGA